MDTQQTIYERLHSIYLEQTTADEIIIFLLLGTFFTLVLAFVFYSILLFVLSKWMLQDQLSVWRLLFPSRARIREYLAEYVFSTISALLLSTSIVLKHDTVIDVLEENTKHAGGEVVSRILQSEGIAGEVARRSYISVEELVTPLLTEGLRDEANLIVKTVIGNGDYASNVAVLQPVFLGLAGVLLLAYVVWFSRQRILVLNENGASDPYYSDFIKKLAVPAVCVPLLLTSAIKMEPDVLNEAIAASTLSLIGSKAAPDNTPLERALSARAKGLQTVKWQFSAIEFEQIDARIDELRQLSEATGPRVNSLHTQLEQIERAQQAASGNVRTISSRLDTFDSSMSALTKDMRTVESSFQAQLSDLQQMNQNYLSTSRLVNENKGRIDAVSVRVTGVDGKTGDNKNDIRKLGNELNQVKPNEGMLLVVNTINPSYRYEIKKRQRGKAVHSGISAGLYALEPGTYYVVPTYYDKKNRNWMPVKNNRRKAIKVDAGKIYTYAIPQVENIAPILMYQQPIPEMKQRYDTQ